MQAKAILPGAFLYNYSEASFLNLCEHAGEGAKKFRKSEAFASVFGMLPCPIQSGIPKAGSD